MIDLTGKTALISGSSRGIGKGIALEMARAGADITVNYHSHLNDAENVANKIKTMGQQAIIVGADVSDRDGVDHMFDETEKTLGTPDIIVANAYYSKRDSFLNMDLDEMRKTYEVSLFGAFNIAQAGAQRMIKAGKNGSILFISSVMSFLPFSTSLAYSSAKAGMNHMAAIIALELLDHRIRVNVIEPGWTDTPGERTYTTEKELEEGGKRLPWGRLGTIEDLGIAATFLCSDAADYITGVVMRVDGGFWLKRGTASIQE